MQELSDAQLLAAFAGHGDEAAFREFVTRYTDLVYSAALRQVESSAVAADIAQSVFTDLARKATTVVRSGTAPASSLAGWLHRATRYAALNYLRDARRRLTNERQAMEQLLTNSESSAHWDQIRPVLDEALDSLDNEDREALLLRYFKNQDFRAVGLALGVSDDAAQKRVSRAVDRLREHFSKRNVTIGAGGLVILISANAVQAAPAGLIATISTTALAVATAATSTVTATAATKTIAMAILQKSIITLALAAAVGAAVYKARQASDLQTQVTKLSVSPPVSSNDDALLALRGQISLLQGQNASLTGAIDKVTADNAQLKKQLEQARHSTDLFRELASQAGSTNDVSTNDFANPREAFVEMGHRFRQIALWKSQDTSNMTADQVAANDAAAIAMMQDFMKLIQSMKQLDSSSQTTSNADNNADCDTCLLYGALNLTDQQFSQVESLLQKYHDQAQQQNLLDNQSAPDNAAALKQMNQQAQTDLQNLLTPEQTGIFAQISSGMQLVTGNFNLNLNLDDKPKQNTAAK